MSDVEPCDCLIGMMYDIDQFGEEIFTPIYLSDQITPDEEFIYCSYCGRELD